MLNWALRCGDYSLMIMDMNNFKIISISLRKVKNEALTALFKDPIRTAL